MLNTRSLTIQVKLGRGEGGRNSLMLKEAFIPPGPPSASAVFCVAFPSLSGRYLLGGMVDPFSVLYCHVQNAEMFIK